MNWLQIISDDKGLRSKLFEFLSTYGISGLDQALQIFEDMQQEYICRNKTSVSKIKIKDICYIDIREHTIIIHTEYNEYRKYGSLNEELKNLSRYGFVKCRGNCIVSLLKIRAVEDCEIILTNGEKISMSRGFASKVMLGYSFFMANKNEM